MGVDPYVATVAVGLKALGLPVTETFAEAVVPADHVIRIADGWVLDLVWDGTAWSYLFYPGPGRGCRAAGTLGLGGHGPDAPAIAWVANDLIDTFTQLGSGA